MQGLTTLGWVVRAAEASAMIDQVVVATTHEPEDDEIVSWCESNDVRWVRGPVEDVLSRFLIVADTYGPDAIVRLTADCPLLDPCLIDAVVGLWRANPVHYVSTVSPRSLPRGLDVELIRTDVLRGIDAVAEGADRSHVTSHVYTHPDQFELLGVTVSPRADDLRVTLDTTEDARLLDRLTDILGNRPPSWTEVVGALRADPDLVQINANVRQKALSEG
jgi:spore coat polysaccharide biosynthesis protein SpsF